MNYAHGVRWFLCLGLLVTVLALSPTARAQWIEFVDATASALNAEQNLVANDPQEKDYAWGDLDKDGDIDLVVVRKQPFTTSGKRPNVLLLNQDGVLTDRTADFASASETVGDNGFLTPTNDRDVVLVDVDLDGWLDIVTSPTLSDDDPKSIGHPRIYWNRGCTGPCATTEDWQGFIYEDARMPQLLSYQAEEIGNPSPGEISPEGAVAGARKSLRRSDGLGGERPRAVLHVREEFNPLVGLLRVLDQDSRLQLRPILLPDPREFEFCLLLCHQRLLCYIAEYWPED